MPTIVTYRKSLLPKGGFLDKGSAARCEEEPGTAEEDRGAFSPEEDPSEEEAFSHRRIPGTFRSAVTSAPPRRQSPRDHNHTGPPDGNFENGAFFNGLLGLELPSNLPLTDKKPTEM